MGKVQGMLARRRLASSRASAPEHVQRRSQRVDAASLLAPAHGLALPSLDGVPTEFVRRENDANARALAVALLEYGLAAPAHWSGDVFDFLMRTLEAWIAKHAGDIEDLVPVHAVICDGPDRWGGYSMHDRDEKRPPVLWIVIGSANTYMPLVLRDTIELLDRAHPLFPVTFYRWFCSGLHRVVNIWDYNSAMEYEERLLDYELDDDADEEVQSFYNDRIETPAWAKRRALSVAAFEKIAQAVNPVAAAIVRSAHEVYARSCIVTREQVDFGEEWSFAPVPTFLLSIEQLDRITGHFDAEMNDLQQTGEPFPPSWVVEIDLLDRDSVIHGVQQFWNACAVLRAAAETIALMPNAITPRPLSDVLDDDDEDGALVLDALDLEVYA
jgi:hypothetical protein